MWPLELKSEMAHYVESRNVVEAIESRNVPKVMQIIKEIFELGSIPANAADVLRFVCHQGSLDDIKTLVEKYKYPTDTALLHVVCERQLDRTDDILKYLIDDVGLSSTNIVREYDGKLPLHVACMNCQFHKDNRVKLVSVGSDVNRQDGSGDTPLHLACKYGSADIVKFLVDELKCLTNLTNRRGQLPLHIGCYDTGIDYPLSIVKLVSAGCDVNRQDEDGNTPLHEACYSHGIDDYDILKFLVEEKKCDVNVTNNSGELPLHFACRYAYSVDKVKVASSGCSNPNAVTDQGDTVLHEACKIHRRGRLEVVRFLCEELGCNPNLSNLKGQTPLHLACHRSLIVGYPIEARDNNIVKYLVLVARVDVEARDNENTTPLMCTPLSRPDIVKILIENGANPQHLYETYQNFFHSYSSKEPPSTPLSIIVIGNHASGKSTLIKALESEGCQEMVHAEAFTAGIIPSAYESESFGSVIWYDLAGQSEYYASHEAILHTILSASPPLILLLVDVRKNLEYIQQDILYWLNFLHRQSPSESIGTKPHLVVVLSFADLCPVEDSKEKVQNISRNLAPDFIQFQLQPILFIPLDCRMPNSDEIMSLRSQLSACFKELCGIAKMNFTLHCFYAFLLGKFKSIPAVTLRQVLAMNDDNSNYEGLSLAEMELRSKEQYLARLLPVEPEGVLRLCEELNEKGHIILLKNNSDIKKSWLIIQTEMILNEVNGSLFAPQHFKQHCKQLSTSTGVVTYSNLTNLFPCYDPSMLIGFLTHMEFCQEIDDEIILQLLVDSDLKSQDSQRFFFFPGLVSIEKPEKIWKDDLKHPNTCGWILQTSKVNEFFTPRFVQVLLLRVAFNYPLAVKTRRQIGIPQLTLQRQCSVWKNGICWKTGSGLECLVEVTEQCQAVVLMLRSISSSRELTSHYISYRSSLIKIITSSISDICPSLEISESFCHPDHIQYPPRSCEDTALYSLPSIAHALCKQQVLVSCDDPQHESIELEKLVAFEPFSYFSIHQLFNSSENENVIPDDYLQRVSQSICSNEACRIVYIMFTQEQRVPGDLQLSKDTIFQVLVNWRKINHATYSDLNHFLSQYSIFCDRDPQVSTPFTFAL